MKTPLTEEERRKRREYYLQNKWRWKTYNKTYYENHKDEYYKWNRDFRQRNPGRIKVYKQTYAERHPERIKLRGVIDKLKKYGLTLADYEQMITSQKGLCALCRKPSKERALAVDHNHTTGKIRELLCGHCNAGLGYFFEDTTLLSKAIQYLERHS